ncbi:MAG: FliH/SctL family protein [Edaphobacter sp.]|uniref:FliH/SctL family protein n=1 Tax=Edaphobacter sp. TaxID=1934404 RepID=UPI0023A0D490|nr:FliH/SctL family protein [Edaphobacter sp.]MDE1178372.1 FliH/SctL family protein [Edaphobacter sp.]
MISPFEERESLDEALVLPLEFVSLDEPEEDGLLLAAEREAMLRERAAALESRIVEVQEEAQRTLSEEHDQAKSERDELVEMQERELAAVRQQVAAAVAAFEREQDRYLREVEHEVVSLALAIAGQVLHRESVMDPMLLRGVVRVALEKVAAENNVTLRVPAGQGETWRSAMMAEERTGVNVVEDRQLGSGDAVLDTAVGRIGLGITEQLREVERGFFDLLAKRPAR